MIKKKQIAALVLAGTMAMGSSMQAFACMGVYVGKEVSENGSSYIGRISEWDIQKYLQCIWQKTMNRSNF